MAKRTAARKKKPVMPAKCPPDVGCPCESDVEDIGPEHVDGCRFKDPNYDEGF